MMHRIIAAAGFVAMVGLSTQGNGRDWAGFFGGKAVTYKCTVDAWQGGAALSEPKEKVPQGLSFTVTFPASGKPVFSDELEECRRPKVAEAFTRKELETTMAALEKEISGGDPKETKKILQAVRKDYEQLVDSIQIVCPQVDSRLIVTLKEGTQASGLWLDGGAAFGEKMASMTCQVTPPKA